MINNPAVKEANFYLFDSMGHQILKEDIQFPTEKIDLPNLSTGIYMVNIIDSEGKFMVKKFLF